MQVTLIMSVHLDNKHMVICLRLYSEIHGLVNWYSILLHLCCLCPLIMTDPKSGNIFKKGPLSVVMKNNLVQFERSELSGSSEIRPLVLGFWIFFSMNFHIKHDYMPGLTYLENKFESQFLAIANTKVGGSQIKLLNFALIHHIFHDCKKQQQSLSPILMSI